MNALRDKTEQRGIILFLTPSVLIILIFFIFPLFFLLGTSITDWRGGTFEYTEFIGLENYKWLVTDPEFWQTLLNTIIWAASAVLIHIPLAMITAMILARKPRGWKFLQVVYFFPQVVSRLALALVWIFMYNPTIGLVNSFLRLVGADGLAKNWLGLPSTALPAVIGAWIFYVGFYMLIFVSQIWTIPKDVYEAAIIDGASTLQQEMLITIPLMRNTFFVTAMLAVTASLQSIEFVFMMTNGGPGVSSQTLPLLMYKSMIDNMSGLANAVGFVVVLLGIALILSMHRFGMTKEDY